MTEANQKTFRKSSKVETTSRRLYKEALPIDRLQGVNNRCHVRTSINVPGGHSSPRYLHLAIKCQPSPPPIYLPTTLVVYIKSDPVLTVYLTMSGTAGRHGAPTILLNTAGSRRPSDWKFISQLVRKNRSLGGKNFASSNYL